MVYRMEPIPLYFTLLLAGFVLIGMEIFIPGGILGIVGAIAWIAASIVGWRSFPAPWDLISALSLLIAGILTFIIWMRYFPKSRIGKSLSLNENSAAYKSHIAADIPIGTVGTALSPLRPSGIASFDGKRMDVISSGEWIGDGEPVKVSSISGGTLVVTKA